MLLETNPAGTDRDYKALANGVNPPYLPDGALQEHVERLYALTSDLLDKSFKIQAKVEFRARYSEMYFAAVAKVRLHVEPCHPSDNGPDLYLSKLDCWAEIVTSTDGALGNSATLTEPTHEEVYPSPLDKIILRLTTVIYDKSNKLRSDITKSHLNIKPTQPIIICVNAGWLADRILYGEGEYHPIVKAVLPVGARVYWRPMNSPHLESVSTTSTTVEYRGVIEKPNGKSVPTDMFLSETHKHISAVVFFNANAINPILNEANWGNDFVTVHNPFASVPLAAGAIKCGLEYLVEATATNFTIQPVKKHGVD